MSQLIQKIYVKKLDLNLCSENEIEFRLPLELNKYKIDLILSKRNLYYNIFDLNNSFIMIFALILIITIYILV